MQLEENVDGFRESVASLHSTKSKDDVEIESYRNTNVEVRTSTTVTGGTGEVDVRIRRQMRPAVEVDFKILNFNNVKDATAAKTVQEDGDAKLETSLKNLGFESLESVSSTVVSPSGEKNIPSAKQAEAKPSSAVSKTWGAWTIVLTCTSVILLM